MSAPHYDVIIVGSGFGGSVSALRLTEKGHRVLVIEKGRRFSQEDFPTTNWNVRQWLWQPQVGLKGFFQMSLFEHATVYHGVGVGGGSLVYANTLPTPPRAFYEQPSWGHLADWERELEPHYRTAQRMLGAATNPFRTRGDEVLLEVARDMGIEDHARPSEVGVFFGEPGVRVPDPYFGGQGPDRTGCTACGACLTGCRVGAKNTLDRNYLYLAEAKGATVLAETVVSAVRPKSSEGYLVEAHATFSRKQRCTFTARRVIFAGGVLGTVPLLLRMREDEQGLPNLSPRVGDNVRTNSEAIIGIIVPDPRENFSRGVAITSILDLGEASHVEPVRFAQGSGFFRPLVLPHAPGNNIFSRLGRATADLARHPIRWLDSFSVADFARQTQMLLYMRVMEGTLSLRLERSAWTAFRRGLVTRLDDPRMAPQAFMEEATDVARRFAERVGGVPVGILTDTLRGVPSTAHILGGACMGHDAEEGVIDALHRVHGYEGLYVMDGSAVSANPGVNPSLTIAALTERAVARIPGPE